MQILAYPLAAEPCLLRTRQSCRQVAQRTASFRQNLSPRLKPTHRPRLTAAPGLASVLHDEVQRHLTAKGLKLATGTIVDATIITAPSSTKNADKARDPEMH